MAKILDNFKKFYGSHDRELESNRVKLDEEIKKDYGDMVIENPAMGYILKECGII